jgi:pilus assembly protein CpaD
MIANPGDLLGQRTLGPGDLARRATVLTKFRNGESSHAARSDQERGTISQAIN